MDKLLEINNLKVYFAEKKASAAKQRTVKAVDDVSFEIRKNETLGLVGESGCGKSTIARAIVRLVTATKGEIRYGDVDLTRLNDAQMKPYRRNLQMVFQDPYASLNPRHSVLSIVGEPFRIHTSLSSAEIERNVARLLEDVGLSHRYMYRYPHEFSGGQRQRISIARAIALNPDFVICDEAVSALDVSVQAQVLNLLNDLKHRYRLTYLFISHDLSVIRHVSDRILVMYLGKVAEIADKADLFASPFHPYTRLLMKSIPIPDPDRKADVSEFELGEIPSVMNVPSGCRFRTRCPYASERCAQEEPGQTVLSEGHICFCHLTADKNS